MATCTNLPLTIPKDGSPIKSVIRDIIGTFLTTEWSKLDPETLVVTRKAGYANRNYVVERPTPDNDTHTEPLKVFFKINGELDGEIAKFIHLVPNKYEEARLCYDYGQTGLGANVYGFFLTQDGSFGRVEEYLDARNLTPEDVEDANLRAEVAKGYAVFSSMAMQLTKKPVEAYYDVLTRELGRYYTMEKLKKLADEGGVSMDQLIEYDFVSRIRRVIERLKSIGGKIGWCIHDVQFGNVLVKNQSKPGESRIVLIDFEFVFQNYRAFDIGGHFLQKMFNWFDEDNHIADCRPYAEEEKRHFCDEYARQWNQETGDSDTGEQVYMESELAIMLAITFEIHNMLCFMDEDDDNDPLNILGLNKLFLEFVNQYEKLGLDI